VVSRGRTNLSPAVGLYSGQRKEYNSTMDGPMIEALQSAAHAAQKDAEAMRAECLRMQAADRARRARLEQAAKRLDALRRRRSAKSS
jgi:hypothetical protein